MQREDPRRATQQVELAALDIKVAEGEALTSPWPAIEEETVEAMDAHLKPAHSACAHL